MMSVSFNSNTMLSQHQQEAFSASTVDAFKTSLPTALHQMYIDVFNCTYRYSSFGFYFGCCFPVGMRHQYATIRQRRYAEYWKKKKMRLVEQKLLTMSDHLSSPPGWCCAIFSFLCSVLSIIVFLPFVLTIVSLLRFMPSNLFLEGLGYNFEKGTTNVKN